MKKTVLSVLLIGIVGFTAYFSFIKIRSLDVDDGGYPLAVRWEGFYHDHNYRDIGTSMNECLGEAVFKEGILTRSAGWFSGWGCDNVGNPDVIFSLNFDPSKNERYFCQSDNGKKIGKVLNPTILLNDLEIIQNWSNTDTRDAVCAYLQDISQAVLSNNRVLIHCNAGRDRTGAFAALISALVAESSNQLDQKMIDAIECDYKKTESLVESKYGRMAEFIRTTQEHGGVFSFVAAQCGISRDTVQKLSQALLID